MLLKYDSSSSMGCSSVIMPMVKLMPKNEIIEGRVIPNSILVRHIHSMGSSDT